VARSVLSRFAALCLSLPESYEQETWGAATFRVTGKIFATAADHEGYTVAMKASREEQAALLAVGEPFFFPRYVGPKGWIGVRLSGTTDWSELDELVRESYRLIAPRRLARELE
jgi:predicted DNA-binding protein (MmcQ/YjbR family)